MQLNIIGNRIDELNLAESLAAQDLPNNWDENFEMIGRCIAGKRELYKVKWMIENAEFQAHLSRMKEVCHAS